MLLNPNAFCGGGELIDERPLANGSVISANGSLGLWFPKDVVGVVPIIGGVVEAIDVPNISPPGLLGEGPVFNPNRSPPLLLGGNPLLVLDGGFATGFGMGCGLLLIPVNDANGSEEFELRFDPKGIELDELPIPLKGSFVVIEGLLVLEGKLGPEPGKDDGVVEKFNADGF